MHDCVLRSRSRFTVAVPCSQSFVDTMLADALTTGTVLLSQLSDGTVKLLPSGLMEALIRCAMCKFELIPTLNTARRMAALLDIALHQLEEQEAVSRYMNAAAPARFLAETLADGIVGGDYKQREHNAWVLIWQHMDLSDLPGFPVWEKAACEQLQA